MKPRVSIITPSYNQAQFLEDTIQSVLRQDYPALEYILVDGGSMDGSKEIIQRYEDKLAWWVSEPDQGQADAINKGFRRATGEIIAWLNSDDLYLPGAIEEAVELFKLHPEAGVVFGDAVSADEKGRLLNPLRAGNWGLVDLLQFKIICQPAVFMRRAAVEEVGFLDPSYHFFLDHQLWIRLAKDYPLVYQPGFWAVSRYHPAAKNITLALKSGAEAYRILEWAEREPGLKTVVSKNHDRIWAGAHAIGARYLLDGGKAGEAFKSYTRAAAAWPPLLRSFWHRYLFSGLSTLGLGFLGRWYYSVKNRVPFQLESSRSLADWPGIQSG